MVERVRHEEVGVAVWRELTSLPDDTHDAQLVAVLQTYRLAFRLDTLAEQTLCKAIANDANHVEVIDLLLRECPALEELVLINLEEVRVGLVRDGLDELAVTKCDGLEALSPKLARTAGQRCRRTILDVGTRLEPFLQSLLAERHLPLTSVLCHDADTLEIQGPGSVRLGINGSQLDVIHHGHHHREGQGHCCPSYVYRGEQLFLPHHREGLLNILYHI